MIAESIAHYIGGFKIEIGKISNKSTDKCKIILSYSGSLPACLAEAESAAVKTIVTV